MKDTVITVRLPMATRRRIEKLARREGRSLSGQVERLLDRALAARPSTATSSSGRVRPLAGVLAGGRTPTLADFHDVRNALSGSLLGRTGRSAKPGR